ncbi:MAG: hypothetical protein POELPBGB_02481 [Bacteroidia bacterium]|nr:hypothetical protein [Bacteroidia bacterium]
MKKRFYQLSKQVLSLSIIALCTLLFSNQVFSQGVSINGTGTSTAPDASAILDLNVSGLGANAKKGFLFPRVALTGTTDATTIPSPATSLTVYNTATGGGVSPGFYYNSGTPGAPAWLSIGGSGSAPTAGNDIDVSGTQVDVEPILNYVNTIYPTNGGGTGVSSDLTLNAPFLYNIILQANSVEKARLASTGNFGIGDATPAELFTVGNGDLFRVNASGDLIRINNVPYTWPSANASANGQVLSSTTVGALTWNDPGSLLTAGTGISITGNTIANTGVLSFSASGTGLTPNTATTGAVTLAGTLDVDNGGTGATTLTGMLQGNGTSPVTGVTGTQWGATYWSTANTIASTAAGTAGNLLMSNGAGAPTWSNNIPANDADYIWNQISAAQTAPSNFWISNIGKIDGSLQLKGTGANYTTITSAATGNYTLTLPVDDGNANQVLATNGTGTLSWATPMTNPMDQWGDIIFGSDASNPSTPDDLNPGTAGLVLHTNGVGANPTWAVVDLDNSPNAEVGGILGVGNGGTGVANPTSGSLLVGAGASAMTVLTGAANYTIYHNGTTWTTNSNATTGLLSNGTSVGIGVAPVLPSSGGAYLDITGSNDGSVTPLALNLRNGDTQNLPSDAVQIAFGYNGTTNLRHNIRTRHNNTSGTANAIDFYLFKPGTDVSPALGSNRVFTIFNDGVNSGVELYGGIFTSGSWGTAGQVLASGGTGVAPTWVNAATGSVTSVSVVNANGFNGSVANATTTPAITISTTQTGMLKGNGTAVSGVTGTQYGATYWSDANTIAATAAGTTGQILQANTGAAPSWSSVSSLMADLTATNGLNLTTSPYDGSAASAVKLGGNLTDASTTITQDGAEILTFANTGTGGTVVNLTSTGDFVVQDNGVTALIVNDDGNVGIGGASNASYKLTITGKVKSTGINETSDARLKMNFAAIDGALNKVLSMNGKYYNWRTEEYPNKGLESGRQVGVIAQEIEKILPEVVTTGDDGFKAVEYSHIVPVLIEAIKEQQKIIDGQNSTISDLKASLKNILNRVNIIEKNSDLNSSKVEK